MGNLPHCEVLGLLRRARFLVFPSECYETFGMSIAEAFASGVPVIASRLGAMAELVDDRRTGLLFRPGDAADLADRIRWAHRHPEEMEVMGRAGRLEYEDKFTAARNQTLLSEIYDSALASAHGR